MFLLDEATSDRIKSLSIRALNGSQNQKSMPSTLSRCKQASQGHQNIVSVPNLSTVIGVWLANTADSPCPEVTFSEGREQAPFSHQAQSTPQYSTQEQPPSADLHYPRGRQ